MDAQFSLATTSFVLVLSEELRVYDRLDKIHKYKILRKLIVQVSQRSIKYLIYHNRYVILNILREEEVVGLRTEYRKLPEYSGMK